MPRLYTFRPSRHGAHSAHGFLGRRRRARLRYLPPPDTTVTLRHSWSRTDVILAWYALLAVVIDGLLTIRRHFPVGHLPELFQEESGDTDFKWLEQYGSIVRVKAPFGVSALCSGAHSRAPAAFPRPSRPGRSSANRRSRRPGRHAVDIRPESATIRLPDIRLQLSEAARATRALASHWRHRLDVGGR